MRQRSLLRGCSRGVAIATPAIAIATTTIAAIAVTAATAATFTFTSAAARISGIVRDGRGEAVGAVLPSASH